MTSHSTADFRWVPALLMSFLLACATVTLAPELENQPGPQLVIDDETIVRGLQSRQRFKSAIHRSISDW